MNNLNYFSLFFNNSAASHTSLYQSSPNFLISGSFKKRKSGSPFFRPKATAGSHIDHL